MHRYRFQMRQTCTSSASMDKLSEYRARSQKSVVALKDECSLDYSENDSDELDRCPGRKYVTYSPNCVIDFGFPSNPNESNSDSYLYSRGRDRELADNSYADRPVSRSSTLIENARRCYEAMIDKYQNEIYINTLLTENYKLELWKREKVIKQFECENAALQTKLRKKENESHTERDRNDIAVHQNVRQEMNRYKESNAKLESELHCLKSNHQLEVEKLIKQNETDALQRDDVNNDLQRKLDREKWMHKQEIDQLKQKLDVRLFWNGTPNTGFKAHSPENETGQKLQNLNAELERARHEMNKYKEISVRLGQELNYLKTFYQGKVERPKLQTGVDQFRRDKDFQRVLEEENRKLKEEINQLHKKLDNQIHLIETQNDELSSHRVEKELRERLEKANAELKMVKHEINKNKESYNDLKNKLDNERKTHKEEIKMLKKQKHDDSEFHTNILNKDLQRKLDEERRKHELERDQLHQELDRHRRLDEKQGQTFDRHRIEKETKQKLYQANIELEHVKNELLKLKESNIKVERELYIQKDMHKKDIERLKKQKINDEELGKKQFNIEMQQKLEEERRTHKKELDALHQDFNKRLRLHRREEDILSCSLVDDTKQKPDKANIELVQVRNELLTCKESNQTLEKETHKLRDIHVKEKQKLEKQIEEELHRNKDIKQRMEEDRREYKRKIDKLQKELNKSLRLHERNEDDCNGNLAVREMKEKLDKANRELEQVRRELEDAKTRLSKIMGQKLTDNNPNIADLSDKNRPTKLAERYTELYDNQWTDAFEIIDDGDDEKTIKILKQILQDAMAFCRKESADQLKRLQNAVTLAQDSAVPDIVNKHLKDCRKIIADSSGKQLYKTFICSLRRHGSPYASFTGQIEKYIEEVFQICWLMSVQDPPVVFGKEVQQGEPFSSDVFRAYTKSGSTVEFVVWPPVYLYEGGAVLCKGVAQGCR